MNPENPIQQPDPRQRVGNELTVMQPGEAVIVSIKRHPVGIIGIYAILTIMLAVVAILGLGVLPSLISGSGSQATGIGAVVFLLLATIALVYAMIATKVYWGNSWVLTSDSITQISQKGLFKRESSQLSLANLEDVTAEQNGVLTHMFNYGVIKAETAGHRSKFVFLYCPNPNYYAQQILHAREAFEQKLEGAEREQYSSQPQYYNPMPTTNPTPPTNPMPPQQPDTPDQQPPPGFHSNTPS